MLDSKNYSSVQAEVTGNVAKYLPQMASVKSSIQNEIASQLTNAEICDIRDCKLNKAVVEKLAKQGNKIFKLSDRSDMTLYCICMAIGTIIKEYDWGTGYVNPIGMCEMAKKVGKVHRFLFF